MTELCTRGSAMGFDCPDPDCLARGSNGQGKVCSPPFVVEAPEGLCGPVGSTEACAPQCCRDGRPGAAMGRQEAKEDAERAIAVLGNLVVDGFVAQVAQGFTTPTEVRAALGIPGPMTRDEVLASMPIEDRVALGLEEAPAKPSILEEAQSIVNGPRRASYGHPSINFERIALLWNAYIDAKCVDGGDATLTAQDVTQMMIHLKQCRLIQNAQDRDGHVDIAGYAQCSALIVGIDT